MSARLIEALATTGPLAESFSDRSVLQAMLDFEVALARAEAVAGVIPLAAADAIASAANPEAFDVGKLAYETLRAGTPGIPLAKALTAVVRGKDAAAAGFVHWGATSQDVADTALVLLLKRARAILIEDSVQCEKSLEKLSDLHKNTVMLGRTLLQAAPPVTFGLKAAGWMGGIRRGRERLNAAFEDALVLQFGGASGTLASLGENGPAVARALAEDLGLRLPESPWHTQRDRLAALICTCGVLTGSLGKMASDIALLMQNEVAEVAEPGGDGRGGSSTMPHKQNPIACSLALAAAHRVPGLVASLLSAMVQEHERGVGGWQAEWPIVAAIVQSTGLAAASMAEVAEGLSVDPRRMRVNIEATNGAIFAERAVMLLGPKLGRDRAHELVKGAARTAGKENRHLADVLAEMPEVSSHVDSKDLKSLRVPEEYLGSAELFRKALLSDRARSVKKER
jgi:3-carboxy-cis,cis-muconate cycloisomerase